MPYAQLDRHQLRVKPLRERHNKVDIARDHVPADAAPANRSAFENEVFRDTVERVRQARANGRPVIVTFGAHTIKNGLGPVLIRLMEEGWVTHLATNGAGIIHDWEFAYLGESSEDVRANVDAGQFGIWQETGHYINLAIVVGAYRGMGYGEAVGAMIQEESLTIPAREELQDVIKANLTSDPARSASAADLLQTIATFDLAPGKMPIPHPCKPYSVQGNAYRLGIPFTGHPMIGHDIIYNHPMNCGAAIGRTAERDFLSFAHQVRQLDGGVYLSIGSAVMSPMIFEKSLSMSQNLEMQEGRHIDQHYMLIVDLAESTWDWSRDGEPPMDNPAYYLRYCKTFNRMGGTMHYMCADNREFLTALREALEEGACIPLAPAAETATLTVARKKGIIIMTKQKCFLVCNAHLDPVWLWTWEEGLTEAISTYRVAADFLDEHPEFVFNHNESLLYEWVERNDPELFERIKKHVASGRWHLAGGAYLQPDLIATSGESAIRQFLIGKRYFAEKFGTESRVAHNFDTFGHPQGMIQILAGCDIDAYVFCRPGAAQMELPIGSFRWEHKSGVDIIARRSDDHYITQGEIRKQMVGSAVQGNENDLENDTRPGSWPAHYREAEGDFMFLWGLGNHGGGVTRQEYDQLPGMRADFPEVEFIESTTDAFFEHTLEVRGRENLPAVTGDLNQINEGCYTSMLRVKQEHRAMENMMHLTEKLCAMAWWGGKKEYPTKDLEVAWKDILFAEFHDILPGSGIPKVEEDSLKMLAHCEEILRRKKTEAMIALLRNEPLAERDETPFFIFNPHNWEVSREVVVEYGTAVQAGTDSIVRKVFCDGEEVDVQFEKGDMNLDNPDWGEWRQKAVFKVTIPPMSYKRFDTEYTILPEDQVVRWQSPAMPAGDALEISGETMAVTVNLTTGLIDSVKVGGHEQVTPGAFAPVIFDDTAHSWVAAETWERADNTFRLATPQETTAWLGHQRVEGENRLPQKPVQIIEDGPVRTVVEAYFVDNHSFLTQRYIINKRSAVLELELDIFWAEKCKMLKLGFTPVATLDRIWAEKCYSIDDDTDSVDRPDKERSFQHFLRRTDGTNHVGFISHGTHAYHQEGNTTWLSVLRSPGYGCHQEAVSDWPRFCNRRMPYQDQGDRQARFTFVFGAEAASNEAMARKAYEYNVGLDSLVYFPTKRDAAPTAKESFITTDRENVILGTMKKAEGDDALILRFWEVAGEDTEFTISLDGKQYSASINAHSLLTLKVDQDGNVTKTNLIEREIDSKEDKYANFKFY